MYIGKTNAVVTVNCPYFKSEYVKSVTCEGYGNAIVITKFPTEADKDRFIEQNCIEDRFSCPLAIGLEIKYEE